MNVNAVSPVVVTGPGQQLRQAREDLRLPVEDVAHLLNLSPRQIVSLEGDDYASLPGATYVRGYLRSYAHLLNLSPEKVIETYNSLIAARTPPPDLLKLTPPPQARSDDKMVMTVTLGVTVLVLALAVVWWAGRREVPVKPPPSVTLAPSAQLDPPPATGRPAESPAPTAPMAPSQPAAEAVAEPKAAAAPLAAKPALADVAGANEAAAPRSRLVLIAEQESWADVRDASQTKLLYETLPAGRRVALEGVAPLNVFLGNVEGVRVEFNGEPYDALPHRRGQVARFTLGANGGPR